MHDGTIPWITDYSAYHINIKIPQGIEQLNKSLIFRLSAAGDVDYNLQSFSDDIKIMLYNCSYAEFTGPAFDAYPKDDDSYSLVTSKLYDNTLTWIVYGQFEPIDQFCLMNFLKLVPQAAYSAADYTTLNGTSPIIGSEIDVGFIKVTFPYIYEQTRMFRFRFKAYS